MRDSEYNANLYMSGDVESRNVGEASNAPGTSCPTPKLAVPTGRPVAGVAPGPLTLQDWWRTSALRGAGTVIDASIRERYERQRQARIDRGEECPKCKGRDIERQDWCSVFYCRACNHCAFDLRGAE